MIHPMWSISDSFLPFPEKFFVSGGPIFTPKRPNQRIKKHTNRLKLSHAAKVKRRKRK